MKVTIKTRIITGFMVIIVLSAMLFIINYPILSRLKSHSEEILPKSQELLMVQGQIESLGSLGKSLEIYILIKSDENKRRLNEDLDECLLISERFENSSNRENVDTLKEDLDKLGVNVNSLRDLLEGQGDSLEINRKIMESYDSIKKTKETLEEMQSEASRQHEGLIKEQNLLVKRIYRNFIWIEIIILISGVLISIFLSKLLLSQIYKLKIAADEIGKGNLDARAEIDSNDEIGDLAKTFNETAKELKKSRKEIKRANMELERKVKSRTKELNESLKDSEKLNKLMVDRELKMIELKEEVNSLLKKLNEEPKYDVQD